MVPIDGDLSRRNVSLVRARSKEISVPLCIACNSIQTWTPVDNIVCLAATSSGTPQHDSERQRRSKTLAKRGLSLLDAPDSRAASPSSSSPWPLIMIPMYKLCSGCDGYGGCTYYCTTVQYKRTDSTNTVLGKRAVG